MSEEKTIYPKFHFQPIIYCIWKVGSIDWLEMRAGQIVLPCSQRDMQY